MKTVNQLISGDTKNDICITKMEFHERTRKSWTNRCIRSNAIHQETHVALGSKTVTPRQRNEFQRIIRHTEFQIPLKTSVKESANKKMNLPSISKKRSKKKVSFSGRMISYKQANDRIQITSSVDLENIVEAKSPLPSNDSSFELIWLNENSVSFSYENEIHKLEKIHGQVNLILTPQDCINHLRNNADKKIILIVSNSLDNLLMDEIHQLNNVCTIYVYNWMGSKKRRWFKNFEKIKGSYSNIEHICEKLKTTLQDHRHNSCTLSNISINLNRLDNSFMHSILLKEIILELENDNNSRDDFYRLVHKINKEEVYRIPKIRHFEKYYYQYTPIHWYTQHPFIYETINRALRLNDINTIIQARFFIRELHQRIQKKHVKPSKDMTVYRGQALSYGEFNHLNKSIGGLYTFKQFLSATFSRNVAKLYAENVCELPNSHGIILHIKINLDSDNIYVFAHVDDESQFPDEMEILFSMHTIFRISDVSRIRHRLYQIELLLTKNTDQDLIELTENMRKITQDAIGWNRLGKLLLKLEKFDQAEEILSILIENSKTDNSKELGYRYHILGLTKKYQNDYENALLYLSKSLAIYESLFDSCNHDFTTLYNDIGSIYQDMNDHSTALKYHRIAEDKQLNSKPLHYTDLQITYEHLAKVNRFMKNNFAAYNFYQKKLKFIKMTVPFDYSKLSITYENIAELSCEMNQHPEALKLLKKVLKIQHSRLSPIDNDNIIRITNKIGQIYETTCAYQEALTFYQNTCARLRSIWPINDFQLSMAYNKVARIYEKLDKYDKAIQFYKEALKWADRCSDSKLIHSANIHDSLGRVYEIIGEYPNAFHAYRQAIKIEQKCCAHDDSASKLYQQHFADISESKIDLE